MCPRDCRTAARWSKTRSWVAFSRTCWNLSRRCSRVIFGEKGKLCRFFCFQFCFLQDYDSVDLADFAQTIMKGCDINRDGKISKKVKIYCEVFWIASSSKKKHGSQTTGRSAAFWRSIQEHPRWHWYAINPNLKYCFHPQELTVILMALADQQ